jgi:hypothetical protein
MLSVEKLIEESRDPRLQRLPQYARQLIHDLAHRLDLVHRYAVAVKEQAEREVDQAREIAAEGPEGSDTFLDLPRSLHSTSDDYEVRPLGRGANIEFRRPGDDPGEGFNVKLDDDGLKIHGVNCLAVVPVDPYTLKIETR